MISADLQCLGWCLFPAKLPRPAPKKPDVRWNCYISQVNSGAELKQMLSMIVLYM